MTIRLLFLNIVFLSLIFSTAFGQTSNRIYAHWTHYSIDPILPGSSWGTGGPALADYDGDGDLDFWRNELIKAE